MKTFIENMTASLTPLIFLIFGIWALFLVGMYRFIKYLQARKDNKAVK